MTIVFHNPDIVGPGTHVVVVGVGDYPYLPGGSGAHKTPYDDGMKQLSSPPASARAFADWMISRFDNPDRPLATVQLLLSDADRSYQAAGLRVGLDGPAIEVLPATLDSITKTAEQWKVFGAAHPDNLMVFYFCGHGMSKGEECALVAEDYGANQNRPFHGLIDFSKFLIGMSDCPASNQCFFIDACRTSSESLIEAENYGDVLVQRVRTPTKGLAQCVYYSTLGGTSAHGLKGKPSVYTGALLKALNGAGASNASGVWRINTTRLFEAMSHLMRELADDTLPRVQVPQSGSQVTYDLHLIRNDPEVPFLVGIANYAPNAVPPPNVSVAFRQGGLDVAAYPPAAPPLAQRCDWRKRHFEAWLPCGLTELELNKVGAAPEHTQLYLQPPGMVLRGR